MDIGGEGLNGHSRRRDRDLESEKIVEEIESIFCGGTTVARLLCECHTWVLRIIYAARRGFVYKLKSI